MIVVIRTVFRENNKYYPHVFLRELLYNYSKGLKCTIMIELTFLNQLMLIRQANQNNVMFATIGIY